MLWRGALDGAIYREMGIATTYVGRWHSGLLLLGLGEPEHVLDLGVGMAIGGAMLGLLLVVWAWYVRVVLEPSGARATVIVPAVPFGVALREALYLQLLWALYRGVAAMLSGDRLWAVFISLALIAFSWALDPLFTALLSLTVQALWLLVAMHTLWMWFSGQALAHLARSMTCYTASKSS